jgi:OOP family OmpA-OmpF porin
MNAINPIRLLGITSLGLLFATAVIAQESAYYYGGVSAGQSKGKIDEEGITANFLLPGQTTTAIARDEKDTAYKAFLGYQFNRYFALEGGYFNLGKFGFTSTTSPAGTLEGQVQVEGINLDMVGTLPMTEQWSVIGRLGGQRARSKGTFRGTGAVIAPSQTRNENDSSYKVGVGLQYEVNPSFLVRGEVERYRISDTVGHHGNANVYSVSLVFPFGRSATPAPRLAQAPAYVAPTPMPAPVAVPPVVVEPQRQRVTFSAESLFSFDRSALRPEGKAALDAFVQSLMGTQFNNIMVEGHTDRMGSAAYNQTLSMERADTVKTYLVTEGRLDPAKISAIGKGESSPITQPDTCRGTKRSNALIACLQPDRRVEIEVTATR